MNAQRGYHQIQRERRKKYKKT